MFDLFSGRIDSSHILSLINFNVPMVSLRSSNLLRCYFHRNDYGNFEPITNVVRLFNNVGYLFDFSMSRCTNIGEGIHSSICLYDCKGIINLEAVTELTTEGFLSAFKRFTSRRGLTNDMYSDNGLNFVGAANQLNRNFEQHQINLETASN